jgi:hypothetical protein
LRTVIDRQALSYGEISFGVADLVLAGYVAGTWPVLIDDLRRSIRVEVDPAAAKAAAIAFRRERGLLAGEDLRAWLHERELSSEELGAHLRRVVALAEGAGHDEIAPAASSEEIADVLRAEAVFSGALRDCGQLLAHWCAAARGRDTLDALPDAPAEEVIALARADEVSGLDALPPELLESRARRAAALSAEFEAFRSEVASDEALERTLRRHRLDWQRYRYREAVFAEEPAALEAAMCVRDDAMSLEEVAGMARVAVAERTQLLYEVDKHMNGVLVSTPPGQLAGPHPHEGGFSLVEVLERRSPAIEDQDLLARARAELVDDGLERHLVGRVVWHVAV